MVIDDGQCGLPASNGYAGSKAKYPIFYERMVLDKSDLYAFMRARQSGVISTVGANGWPQAARVYFAVTRELELVFYTLETNRKCRNLRGNPHLAAVIGCDSEETVQFEGIAHEPDDRTLEETKQIFAQERPELVGHIQWPGLAFFRVRPVWIRFSSYSKPWRVKEFTFRS